MSPSKTLMPDQYEAKKFLKLLDPNADFFTFQTFDDNTDRKDPSLTRILHGSLEEHWDTLCELNRRGAGVYVTVNETDGKGRKKENIVRARALFQEADRGDEPELPLKPQLVVESSPGKYHRYILANNAPLEEFEPVQQRLVDDYGSDPNAKDRSRVLRLPGFYHQKVSTKKGLIGTPRLVRLVASGGAPYSWAEIKEAILPVISLPTIEHTSSGGIEDLEKIKSALASLDPDMEYGGWLSVGMSLHHASHGTRSGLNLWNEWSSKGDKYKGGECAQRWDTFGSSDNPVTILTLYKMAQTADWSGQPSPPTLSELIEKINSLDTGNPDAADYICGLISEAELTGIQTEPLLHKIKSKTGIPLGTLRNTLREKQDLDTHKGSDQRQAAFLTLESIGRKNLLHVDDQLYRWNSETGAWEYTDDRVIKKVIHDLCDKHQIKFTAASVDGTCNLIKTEAHKTETPFDKLPDVINVRNGELHFNGQDWVLQPHCRDHFHTTQLPITFDPGAKAPRFEQFMQEIFENDEDKDAKISLLLEFMGYTLLNTCRYEKFIMLVGNGANGKSVLLHVIESLLGKKLVCAVQPNQFDNKFQRAHLKGKKANIITEIDEGATIPDGQLKAITSGELITAEHKHKAPFEIHPFATQWFGTNHLPHSRDYSDALIRRAIIIEFPNQFTGSNCDPSLKEKLYAELPGILNLVLQGLSRVLQKNEFTYCRASEEAKKEWRIETDQVGRFIMERTTPSLDAEIETAVLYEHYKRWVDENGIRSAVNKLNFGKRLERLGYPAKKGSQGVRLRTGLRLVGF